MFYIESGKEMQFTKSNKNVLFCLSLFSFIIHRAKGNWKTPIHSTISYYIAHHNADNTSAWPIIIHSHI